MNNLILLLSVLYCIGFGKTIASHLLYHKFWLISVLDFILSPLTILVQIGVLMQDQIIKHNKD